MNLATWRLGLLIQALIHVTHTAKVGIIGGGIGGTSAAYFINHLFGNEAEIHLFEQNKIGGRLDLIEVGNAWYESGGSIIHSRNRYMQNFIDQFGLSRRPPSSSSDTFGLFDGTQMIFESSSWPLVTTAKLFWRYGYDVIKLQRLVDRTLTKFNHIYSQLDSGAAFDTVEDLVMAMDPSMLKLTELPLTQYLKLSGFSERFIDELVAAATLVNYGQRPDIHAFVGLVALAGTGGDLTSVSGGNRQVAEKALEASGATVHSESVRSVDVAGDQYVITSASSDGALQSRQYDIVIVAAPQTADHVTRLSWQGFQPELNFTGAYYNLSVTFVNGELSPSAFGVSSVPEDILATVTCRDVNSFGRNRPVTPSTDASAVKIFTAQPPGDGQLNHWFGTRRQTERKQWLAYPSYSSRASLGNFTLRHGLYYINGIEAAASAMEMSVIGAKNVANMAYTRWFNKSPPDGKSYDHEEL